ncbi:hypothetical protein BH11PLA1_BH11PLA1_01650 [soil metagenome]
MLSISLTAMPLFLAGALVTFRRRALRRRRAHLCTRCTYAVIRAPCVECGCTPTRIPARHPWLLLALLILGVYAPTLWWVPARSSEPWRFKFIPTSLAWLIELELPMAPRPYDATGAPPLLAYRQRELAGWQIALCVHADWERADFTRVIMLPARWPAGIPIPFRFDARPLPASAWASVYLTADFPGANILVAGVNIDATTCYTTRCYFSERPPNELPAVATAGFVTFKVVARVMGDGNSKVYARPLERVVQIVAPGTPLLPSVEGDAYAESVRTNIGADFLDAREVQLFWVPDRGNDNRFTAAWRWELLSHGQVIGSGSAGDGHASPDAYSTVDPAELPEPWREVKDPVNPDLTLRITSDELQAAYRSDLPAWKGSFVMPLIEAQRNWQRYLAERKGR